MSRKALIICISVIAAFVVVITVALSVLYSGTAASKDKQSAGRDYALMSAIPADAVAVLRFEGLESAVSALCSENSTLQMLVGAKERKGKFFSFLDSLYNEKSKSLLYTCETEISFHYIGELKPLLIIDAAKSKSPESAEISKVKSVAGHFGLYAEYIDAGEFTSNDNVLKKRSLLMVSPSDILIQSSQRHLKRSVSILDTEGFSESVGMVAGDDMLIVPNANLKKIISGTISSSYRADAEFLAKFSDCVAFDIASNSEDGLSLWGKSHSGADPRNFLNVYGSVNPSKSEISDLLPSYTVFVAAVPFDDVAAYHSAYMKFAETLALARKLDGDRKNLQKKYGTDPLVWAKCLDLKEIAVAKFRIAGKMEKVLLVRVGNKDEEMVFHPGFVSTLFGSLFAMPDASGFIVKDSWMIVGSGAVIEEYKSGRALEYPLSKYFADADVHNRLSQKDSYFASYYSATEDAATVDEVFSTSIASAVKGSCKDISFEPVFLNVGEGKTGTEISFDLSRKIVLKSQAPVSERNTEVIVPQGPFKVKNSGTGRMNLFYQQQNNYLCLKEDGGKGLWAVPFSGPICGSAQTVDYFANGKLQILFASGTKLHLIDRLGRFVNPFPVDLKKEILIGPDVYDFSGKRRYNVMVLHKDNTIEMYNLQGRKPAEWKGITSKETIKGLPERIVVGGRTFWVVRTSIQTLIFGFYGGEPLTRKSGDKMIRTDSAVIPAGNDAVEVTCYDGKKHTIKLI